MAGHWYAIPLVVHVQTEPSRVCEGENCLRLARWVYVNDAGELYACDDHHALAVQP